nr:MAG TPA: hypothetical protein [Crassvirales sp.]
MTEKFIDLNYIVNYMLNKTFSLKIVLLFKNNKYIC